MDSLWFQKKKHLRDLNDRLAKAHFVVLAVHQGKHVRIKVRHERVEGMLTCAVSPKDPTSAVNQTMQQARRIIARG